MLPIPEYWQAVARAIDAEDAKASIFIKHNASIGAVSFGQVRYQSFGPAGTSRPVAMWINC